MRWPWSHKHKVDLQDEKDKLQDARKQLEEVRQQWPVVMAISSTLHAHKEQNHFADNIAIIFRGGEQK